MIVDIFISVTVALFNLFCLFIYSTFRKKSNFGRWTITIVTIFLTPFFFFLTLYPIILKSLLKNIWNYDDFVGFMTEFLVYTLFVILFHKRIESHWKKWKIK
jgi:hypothetical protein